VGIERVVGIRGPIVAGAGMHLKCQKSWHSFGFGALHWLDWHLADGDWRAAGLQSRCWWLVLHYVDGRLACLQQRT
jgi:hypothetical protein